MSAIAVEEIIDQIKQLPEGDRLLLEERLRELADSEWRQVTSEARETARAKEIDQAAIDRAIDQVRRPA